MSKFSMTLLLCIMLIAQAIAQNQSKILNPRGGEVQNIPKYPPATNPKEAVGGVFFFPPPHSRINRKYKVMIDSNDIAKSKLAAVGGPRFGMKKSAPPHHTITTAGDGPSCTAQFGVQSVLGEDCQFKPDGNGLFKIAYEYIIIGDCTEIPVLCDSAPDCEGSGKEIVPIRIYSHIFKNGELQSDQVKKTSYTLASYEGQQEETYEGDNAFLITKDNFGRGVIKMQKWITCKIQPTNHCLPLNTGAALSLLVMLSLFLSKGQ